MSLPPRPPAGGRPPRRRRPPLLRLVLALVTAFVFVVGWSLGHALTVPGGGTVAERVAEWARSHYMSPLVTFGEWLTYSPPKTGGRPSVPLSNGGTAVGKLKKEKHYYLNVTPIIPAAIGSPAGTPLPGEGQWRLIETVHGSPAMFKTYVRQSKIYSSYTAGIVSMDQRLLTFGLRPGATDPGYQSWGEPYDVPAGQRAGLMATFNGGFRLNAALGGFYLNGVRAGTLVTGAASEVYYKNGTMTIGTWGSGGLTMNPNVVGVRQNLKLIVINGQVPASVDQNVTSAWGATLGGGYNVWRSGAGITADGRIIYVYGPALDVRTLAELLKRAGCVNAMELDINPDWMSFMYYNGASNPQNPVPQNLLSSQIQPPTRYYSVANRDFTVVYSR